MATTWSLQIIFVLCRGVVCVEVSFKYSYVPTPRILLGQPYIFRRVRKILKSDLASSCLSVLLCVRMQQLCCK